MKGASVFTPREIVSELDRYVVGQRNAKRAVAVALRNRWRRQQVEGDLRDEIAPKNIIMIGATGVGKTEIARRLAKLAQAPFIKVEASKFTEVGYVGRDVESIIRDLTELAVKLVSQEEQRAVRARAEERAEERLIDALLPAPVPIAGPPDPTTIERTRETREKLRKLLRLGELDAREIMAAARFCTMVTTRNGDAEARVVDPLEPDAGFVVHIATNPLSRKVQQMRANPRVTLLYFDPTRLAYVTLIGRAAPVSEDEKPGLYKKDWESFFDRNRPASYALYRVVPSRLEVVSARDGLPGDPATWRPEIIQFK